MINQLSLQPNITQQHYIILDIGTAYTKVGFASENIPKKIIRTPLYLFEPLQSFSGVVDASQAPQPQQPLAEGQELTGSAGEDQLRSKVMRDQSGLSLCFQDEKQFALKLEQFINDIFFYELLIKPNEKTIFVIDNMFFPRVFLQKLSQILYEKFSVHRIVFLLRNVLPLYSTGVYTGYVIDCGYLDT